MFTFISNELKMINRIMTVFPLRLSKNAVTFIILWLGAAVVLALYAPGPSPLFPDYGFDFAIFKTMGQVWLDGGLPYRDFFDHKGPFHFLIYAFCLALAPGKLGVFLVFSFLNAVTLFLGYLCLKLLNTGRPLIVTAVIVYLLMLANYTEGGATVEESSLPFQFLPLLYTLKFFKNRKFNLRIPALVCGICFALVALIRINNNCILCGCVLAIAWSLVVDKRYKELVTTIVLFICGCILVLLPFGLYFYSKGILNDVIFGTFTYNLDYKAKWGGSRGWMDYLYNLSFLIPCFVLILAGWWNRKVNSNNFFKLALSIGIITYLTFYDFYGFKHYFLMELPIGILCVGLCQELRRWKAAAIIGLLLLPFIARINQYATRHAFNYATGATTNHKLINQIPSSELNSVYNFGNYFGILWLDQRGHRPVGRFTFLQNNIAQVNSQAKEEIENAFSASNPKWIISTYRADKMYPLADIDKHYMLVDSIIGAKDEGKICLYKRK